MFIVFYTLFEHSPYTNLQLNPYTNTQLDLFCSDNFSFRCTAPSMLLTNCANPNTQLQSPTREVCWLQSYSVHPNDEDQEDAWLQNPTVHKHNFFTRKINHGKIVSPVTNCLNKLCSTLVQLVYTLAALKIILLYIQSYEKRKPKHINMDWSQNRTKTLFFINLNRYPICRAVVEPRGWNNSSSSIDGQLSSFNDRHFLDLNLGQTCMALTLELETCFLKY